MRQLIVFDAFHNLETDLGLLGVNGLQNLAVLDELNRVHVRRISNRHGASFSVARELAFLLPCRNLGGLAGHRQTEAIGRMVLGGLGVAGHEPKGHGENQGALFHCSVFYVLVRGRFSYIIHKLRLLSI